MCDSNCLQLLQWSGCCECLVTVWWTRRVNVRVILYWDAVSSNAAGLGSKLLRLSFLDKVRWHAPQVLTDRRQTLQPQKFEFQTSAARFSGRFDNFPLWVDEFRGISECWRWSKLPRLWRCYAGIFSTQNDDKSSNFARTKEIALTSRCFV